MSEFAKGVGLVIDIESKTSRESGRTNSDKILVNMALFALLWRGLWYNISMITDAHILLANQRTAQKYLNRISTMVEKASRLIHIGISVPVCVVRTVMDRATRDLLG